MPPAEPMTQEIINRLKELLAKATPGPWKVVEQWSVWDTVAGSVPGIPLFTPDLGLNRKWGRDIGGSEIVANATLIVEGINALPALLSTLTNLTPSGVERIRAEAFERAASLADAHVLVLTNDPKLAESTGDAIRALALPSEPPSQGDVDWRDTDGAPRDGTDILICNDRGQFVVSFDNTWGRTGDEEGWWMVSDGKDFDRPLRGDAPYGWKPLGRALAKEDGRS